MNRTQQIRKAPKFMAYLDTASDYKGKFNPTDKMIKRTLGSGMTPVFYVELEATELLGSVTEAEQCETCGEYFREDELHDGVCDECLKEEATVANALECGKDGSARMEVSVNGFLAMVFTSDKIDEILTRELERLIGKSDDHAKHIIDVAETWCLEDKSYFAEWLKGRDRK